VGFFSLLFGVSRRPSRKWGEPYSDEEIQNVGTPNHRFEPFCLNPQCRSPLEDEGRPWALGRARYSGTQCAKCGAPYSVDVEWGVLILSHDPFGRESMSFGSMSFFPFNQKPPQTYIRPPLYIVSYIDPATSVTRQKAYRTPSPASAASAARYEVERHMSYNFGINYTAQIVSVTDENGVAQDFSE
jgi:hypothetical protein